MFRLVTEVIFVLQPALELEPDAEDGGGEGQDRRRGQGQAARRDRGEEEEEGAGGMMQEITLFILPPGNIASTPFVSLDCF